MKRLFFTGCFLLILINSFAQYGNEWIKYNQFYFKIPVAKDGIYKLTYANLQAAGFPVDGVDPRRLQIFHRGVEQSIYVEGQADAAFNSSDFIEFYGKKNDGTLDTELYPSPDVQPHKYYNLYSDTTCYYLTFNPLAVVGKRMTAFSEVNSGNSKPKETYHTDEKILVYSDLYSTGQVYLDYLQNTYFDNAEGFSSQEIRQGNYIDFLATDITSGVTSQDVPQLELALIGRGPMPHEAEIWVGANSGSLRLLTTNDFYGYTTTYITQPLAWGDIGIDGKMVVRVKSNGVDGNSDRFGLAYMKIDYPQQFSEAGLTEKYFQLAVNATGKSYIEIQNPASNTRLYDVTDPTDITTIGTTLTATLNAIVPNTSAVRKLYATNADITPASIRQVTFRQIIPAQHNYIIISNHYLQRPALGYDDPVKAYGGYRASPAGGGYDTLLVDVNLLYNEFSYGEKTPLAIFHFMKFLCATHRPDYLFIIGKGLTVDYKYYRLPSNTYAYKDLVPASGMPPSDMYYSVGLSGTTYEPAVPTGRIPASTPADVAAYLNKVKEMEALPFNALWRKNVLHLSGGIHTGEPETFRSFMKDFETVAEGYHLGGNVKSIPKRSTDIQLINISEEVNKGLNLVTFFGHSSPSTIDFDIGFVTDPVLGYNNPGKYPTLLMNGCNAGAFFLNGKLFGEDWINASNRGAVGFIAHSSYGLIGLLKRYSDFFYSVGYGDSTFIHKGLGDIQKEVAIEFINNMGASIPNITQVQQMILLGDPSVRLFGARKADYEINENNVYIESFDGGPITALTDSFALNMIVRNFGQAKEDSLLVEVTRTFNDNSTETSHKLFPPIMYSDTLSFTIHKDRTKGFGNNAFTVKLDSDDEIAELSETNNSTSKNLLIPLNGTKNLFPSDYAIVNQSQAKLTFQSTDLLSGNRDFLIEVDTVDSFTSQFKKQFTANGNVLVNQIVDLLSQDTLAYYWRTKLKNPLPGESTTWTVSSFTFINNGTDGWAQVHFPQYLKNESIGLVKDAIFRQFEFEETETDVSVKTFGSTNPTSYTNVSVKINDAEYNLNETGGGCRPSTLNLIVFSKTSTVPYTPLPYTFSDSRSCGREPQIILNYQTNEMDIGGDDMIASIDNIVAGDSVVLFTIGDAGFSSWTTNVKNKLGELGISIAQINALQNGEPVVIYGKKGIAPGTAKIYRTSLAPATAQQLEVDKTITGRYTSGKMNSVQVGPAQSWIRFIRQTGSKEASDQFSFDITGVKLNGEETLLMSDVAADVDLSSVSATDYPFLKLSYSAEDDINLTPVQLRKWLVLYEPVAEGILVFNGPKDQRLLREGEIWKDTYAFVNISDKTFSGPLTVDVEIFNETARTSDKSAFEIDAPAPGDTTKFDVTVNTVSKSGLNDVNIFVNPHILPEQYYDNNQLQMPEYLKVQGDVYAPTLDVTVDGRYLSNGDFVSPNPHIVVKLWDENHIVLKTDSTNVNVYFKQNCDNCAFRRINFSSSEVKWYPATNTTDFRVEFNPQNLAEGEYTLQAEGKDVNGNSSGEDPYEVTFVVQYTRTISFEKPWPNPSNGKFFFSLVLSGEDAPESFNLQIVSVNGKVLQEITADPASYHVGTNDFNWDGSDTDGNPQPDGIYIYRAVLTVAGKEVQTHGKLVLIR